MQYTNSFPHSVRAFISAEKAENASQLDALALTSVEAAVPRATENSPSACEFLCLLLETLAVLVGYLDHNENRDVNYDTPCFIIAVTLLSKEGGRHIPYNQYVRRCNDLSLVICKVILVPTTFVCLLSNLSTWGIFRLANSKVSFN